MKIKEVTQKYGISRKALLVYEEKGLIHPIRNMSGYRDYDDQDIETIGKIIFLRKLEFSLDEITDILIYHHHELLQQKKQDYDKEIHFIEMKKSYLDYAYDVFDHHYAVDEAIDAIEDTIELYKDDQYNEMIHFEFRREAIGFMWLTTVMISLLSGQFYLIIAAICSIFIPIICSLKCVRNFFLSVHARKIIVSGLFLLGSIGTICFYNAPDSMMNELLFGASLMLCFFALAMLRQIQNLFQKYQVIISMIFFIIGIVMFGLIFYIEIDGKVGFGYVLIASLCLGIGIIFNRFIRKILGYILLEMI